MKLNFTVNIDSYNTITSLEEKIISESAKQLIKEVMNNRYEHYGKTFREKLQNEVKEMLLNIMDTNFKEEVKNSLVNELSNKYTKTKQYKEVKEQFDIKSDSEIKSGLKDIIEELVRNELKKRFK